MRFKAKGSFLLLKNVCGSAWIQIRYKASNERDQKRFSVNVFADPSLTVQFSHLLAATFHTFTFCEAKDPRVLWIGSLLQRQRPVAGSLTDDWEDTFGSEISRQPHETTKRWKKMSSETFLAPQLEGKHTFPVHAREMNVFKRDLKEPFENKELWSEENLTGSSCPDSCLCSPPSGFSDQIFSLDVAMLVFSHIS